MTYQLYIGSDNNSKRLELAKIEKICSECHEGFTVQRAVGYWHSEKERTALVTISDNKEKILATVRRLKEELRQEAIAIQPVAELEFI